MKCEIKLSDCDIRNSISNVLRVKWMFSKDCQFQLSWKQCENLHIWSDIYKIHHPYFLVDWQPSKLTHFHLYCCRRFRSQQSINDKKRNALSGYERNARATHTNITGGWARLCYREPSSLFACWIFRLCVSCTLLLFLWVQFSSIWRHNKFAFETSIVKDVRQSRRWISTVPI